VDGPGEKEDGIEIEIDGLGDCGKFRESGNLRS
jgi:hypothetical protein